MRPEDRAPARRLLPGAAHFIRQLIKLSLLGEHSGKRLGERESRVPALNRFRSGAVDLDDLEPSLLQVVGRIKSYVEPAIVKVPHRAAQSVDDAGKSRRHQMRCLFVSSADANRCNCRQYNTLRSIRY